MFQQPRLEQIRNRFRQLPSSTWWGSNTCCRSRWHMSRSHGHHAARPTHPRHTSVRVHVACILHVFSTTVCARVPSLGSMSCSCVRTHRRHPRRSHPPSTIASLAASMSASRCVRPSRRRSVRIVVRIAIPHLATCATSRPKRSVVVLVHLCILNAFARKV